MKKIKELLFILTLLPLLFFTSKYGWISKYLVYLFLIYISSFNFLYLDFLDDSELVETSKEIKEQPSNILLSEGKANDEKFAKEFSKSVNRVKDFINISKKDGSGSYPEDFHYQGYKKDDNTVTHSKVPGDWGIDELYDFGNYSDSSKIKESASQIAKWLEYDHRVNEKKHVDFNSDDPTFNSSGRKWFQNYCKANNLDNEQILNNRELRNNFRDIAAGKK